ncbi:hypothetical protein SSOG_02972 [Streptomyces himastatinicus ATCC 53653]|uniref:Secreted protein n=1 Tax=Streptomyces himastatinicus ATCC 53653 TaxID=457427 RepID=D9WG42_9ACTN|nr:hypothetical protein [Streptomyces himastatinicus]EFL23258.1 hypothetical protein SSOG_02972 [Streptomyces himastatinicus ATCC 53653]
MRRTTLAVGGALLAVVVAVAAFAFARTGGEASQRSDQGGSWKGGATPEWMSGQMGIRIPAGASEQRAGYRTGSRYDVGLLSFALPEAKADAFLARLVPDDQDMIKNYHPEAGGYAPSAGFGHLGLPEPETLVKGLRKINFCPDAATSPEGKRLRYCVELYAQTLAPDRTRIYLRSTIEPGLTPPPATSGT